MKPGVVYDQINLDAERVAFYTRHGWMFGDWRFLPTTGEVHVNDVLCAQLTEVESETLNLLIRVYPLVIHRRAIAKEMGRIGCYWHPDTVKVNVRRLRKKLGESIIVVVPHRGYRFNPEAVM